MDIASKKLIIGAAIAYAVLKTLLFWEERK